MKLNLLSDSVKCADMKSEITMWNTHYEIYDKCLKSYSKKTLSEFEFKKIILKYGDESFVDQIISELKEKNIIDDVRYKKLFISSCEHNTKYSSYKIKSKLEELNINLTLEEEEYLKELDFDKASKIVSSVCGKTNNKSKYEMVNACKIKLQSYMFSIDVINEVVGNIDYDEYSALEHMYEKLVRKNETDVVIKKLYAKGYNYDLIKQVKEKFDDKY